MRKSQLLYLFAQTSLAVFHWLVLSILAKKFDKNLVGNYSLVLAWLTPLFLLFGLQIKNRFLTSTSDRAQDLIDLRFHLIIPLTIVASGLFFFDLPVYIIFGVFLLKLGEYIIEIPFVIDQKNNNLLKASSIQLLKNCLAYISILLLIYLNFSFGFSLISGGVLSVASGLVYFFSKKIKLNITASFVTLKNLLPLGISAFLLSLSVSIPRLYLKELDNIEEVAIYTVVFSFYGIWQMLFNNYFTGFLDRMRDLSVKDYILLPLAVYLVCAMIFYIFDEGVYRLLFGEGFVVAAKYTLFLLVNIMISFFNSLLYYRLISKNNYNSHLWINIVTALSTLIIMYFGIRSYGLKGAFASQAIVQLIQLSLYRKVSNGR